MIQTLLTVSTTHISKEDNVLFMESKLNDGIPIISAYDGGWFFYKRESKDEMVEDMTRAKVSTSAIMLFEYAFYELQVDILRIDMDGDVVERLPTFNW